MGVPFAVAQNKIKDAAVEVFDSDVRVHSLGITTDEAGSFKYEAVRNEAKVVPMAASKQSLKEVNGIPIQYRRAEFDIRAELKLPAGGPGSPGASSFVPERRKHNPLHMGFQIQNFDDNDREGILGQGFITIGTLGCFVKLDGGEMALLSNNHVIAGENDGQRSTDRITQPGAGNHADVVNQHVATLNNFADIHHSPAGARPMTGNVVYNVLDAGIATLEANVNFSASYLPLRRRPSPIGFAIAHKNDEVFKVGRTTGLTFGRVMATDTIVGPVPYRHGEAWFERSIQIEGENGLQFSDQGDSGSAIVKTNGEIVGILYAGNGKQTYVCPIEDVLQEFDCTLA